MKSLEERQKEWDDVHTGIAAEMNMELYKYGRPARPSESTDKFYDDAMKPTSSFTESLKRFMERK